MAHLLHSKFFYYSVLFVYTVVVHSLETAPTPSTTASPIWVPRFEDQFIPASPVNYVCKSSTWLKKKYLKYLKLGKSKKGGAAEIIEKAVMLIKKCAYKMQLCSWELLLEMALFLALEYREISTHG